MATLSGFLAVAMSLYQLLYISALFERLGIFIPRTVYLASSLGFVLVLVFLMYPVSKRVRPGKIPWYDIGFIILSLAGTGYIVYVWTTEAAFQYTYATTEGVILGLITTFLVLEATRRTVGWAMPIVVFIFLLYPAFSNFLPGLLHGRGYSLERMMGHLYVSGEGIFGLPLGIAATIVVAYIIFAQFFNESGAGKFFINLANSMVGHFRGGPAKVAVVASALFGTLSGSPVGNVVSTGVITIPMMKKLGYPSHFAAAVEAVASNGGQIMPPVMGAVVFIMVEFLGISYWQVCVSAALPAIIYFLAVFLMVDAEAVKTGLKGLPKSEMPSLKATLRSGWWYFIPLVALIYFLAIMHIAPERAALYSLAILLLMGIGIKDMRMGPRSIIRALKEAGKAMLTVSTTCAAAGIILGAVSLTGLGIRLSSLLVYLSGGHLLALLLLAAGASFILGMGLTVTACYIMLAILVAPALVLMGVTPLAAHFFVLYWGLVSFITPPVAIAAFAAAAIAKSDPLRTGWTATRLGAVTYILPFMWVYGPALLMQGKPADVVVAVVTSIIGCVALAGGLGGYLIGRANWVQRVLLIASSLVLLSPGWQSDLAGIGILVPTLIWLWQVQSRFKKNSAAPV